MNLFRKSFTIFIVVVLCFATLSNAFANSSFTFVKETTPTMAVPQTTLNVEGTEVGRTDANQVLTLLVSLKPTDQAALDNFLRDLYDPASAVYHQFLTPAEFTANFFDSADRTAVTDFITSKGFKPQDSGVGSTITFSGSVKQIEQAFNITISDFKDSQGRVFYSNKQTPALPVAIANKINGLIGLSNSNQIVSHHKLGVVSNQSAASKNVQPATATGCSGATSLSPYGAYTPNQFKTAYNFDALTNQSYTGTGQTVAVFELDNYSDSNINTYKTCFGLTNSVTRKPVDGGVSASGTDGQVEVELDIEVVAGMAPGSSILVYEAPNTDSDYVAEYQAIANDNLAPTISSSWGDCEPDTSTSVENSENTIFQQMAAQGQSLLVAAGDDGSEGCVRINGSKALAVGDSAAQPYATGVGGTRLSLNNSTNAVISEVTWNDYSSGSGAGGGGISTIWPKPYWQTGTGTTNTYSNGKRQVPDVSADASPNSAYAVYVHVGTTSCGYLGVSGSDCWFPIGGTSAATPLWAAGAAVVNSQLAATNSGSKLGFLNPALYNIQNNASSTYRDITVGDNCYDKTTTNPPHTSSCGTPNSGNGTYPATSGYDQATGLGSLNLGTFSTAYKKTTSVSLSTSISPSYFGQSVTFTAHAGPSVGSTVMTGTVTFKDGSTTLGTGPLDNAGTATLTSSSLSIGSHSITAIFNSTNPNYYGNTSPPVIETVVCQDFQVTSTTDNGSGTDCGTLSHALSQSITSSTPVTITFALTAGDTITFTGSPITIAKATSSVVVYGGAFGSSTRIILDGSGVTGDGLHLQGNYTLDNITIKNFHGRQLVLESGVNHLQGVVAEAP